MLPVNSIACYRGEVPGVQDIPHWRGGWFQQPVQARRFFAGVLDYHQARRAFPAVLDYRPLVQSQVQGWL